MPTIRENDAQSKQTSDVQQNFQVAKGKSGCGVLV
jgi:hypothetical protein